MSASTTEAIEDTRKALYANKTNEQMIMLALMDILARLDGAPVIQRELYVRYRAPDTVGGKFGWDVCDSRNSHSSTEGEGEG